MGLVALLVFSGDLVLEASPVAGSQYEKISVTAVSETPPDAQAQAIWAMSAPNAERERLISTHNIIEEGEASRLYYEVVSPPAVAQRDYVLRVKRHKEGDSYVISYVSTDAPEYPPQSGKVRMKVEATCRISPGPSGGSVIHYQMHTELGGALPAWMAREPQRRGVVDAVKNMLVRGRSVLASK